MARFCIQQLDIVHFRRIRICGRRGYNRRPVRVYYVLFCSVFIVVHSFRCCRNDLWSFNLRTFTFTFLGGGCLVCIYSAFCYLLCVLFLFAGSTVVEDPGHYGTFGQFVTSFVSCSVVFYFHCRFVFSVHFPFLFDRRAQIGPLLVIL